MNRVIESAAGRKIKEKFPTSKIPQLPAESDPEYDPTLAALASRILFRSGIDPSGSGPLYVLCAASLPDPQTVDYNQLLPYVLSCLPSEDELSDAALGGGEYSLVFFAGSRGDGKSFRPPWGWVLQAYYLLGRQVRKKIRRLWIVHERSWVRVLIEMLQNVVSPKFRRKIIHVSNLTELSNYMNITRLDIPLQVYLHDRKLSDRIIIRDPPPPVFGQPPFPRSGPYKDEMPFVLTHTTRYLRFEGLKVEGLFRVAASKQILEVAQEAYDRRQKLRLSDFGPHVAAGLVKLYYRSLPEPIIPERMYEELEEYFGRNPPLSKNDTLRRFLFNDESEGGLPEYSRKLLCGHLLPLLALVADYSEDNKMTPSNLAVCTSASLVRSEDIMRDTMIARGPVSQLLTWGMEEIDNLCPELPIRKAPGEEEKVTTPPIRRKPVPSAEALGSSDRDAVSKVDAFYGPAPQIRQQPLIPQQVNRKDIPQNDTQASSTSSVQQNQQQQMPQIIRKQAPPLPQVTQPPKNISPTPAPSESKESPKAPLNRKPSSSSLPVPPPLPRRGSVTINVQPPPPPPYALPKPLRKLSSSSALGSAYLKEIASKESASNKGLAEPIRPVRQRSPSFSPSAPAIQSEELSPGTIPVKSKTPPPPSANTPNEFASPRRAQTDIGPRGAIKRKVSTGMVNELRRLYEERAQAGEVLVSAGKGLKR